MEVQRVESRTRVWLDNIGLTDIDPAIIIHDVSYKVNEIQTGTIDRARSSSKRILLRKFGAGVVTVSFEVHEYSQVFRQSIVERVVAWAMSGGDLTCDDRPNKRLRNVVCTSAPSIESTQRWTNILQIVFTAYENPFWEDIVPIQVTLTGTDASGTIYGPGSAIGPYVEVRAQCNEDVLSTITLNVGNTSIKVENMVIQPNTGFAWSGDLWIYYDDRHIQHIERKKSLQVPSLDDMSLLANRTASSDDDLIAGLGETTSVSFTANVSSTVTFMARGLYL